MVLGATAHVLSDRYTYTTALMLLSQSLLGALPRSLLLGLPVRAMYLALLEWSRAAELSADRAAALVMADPLPPCPRPDRAGRRFGAGHELGGVPEAGEQLRRRGRPLLAPHRFWSELNLTHPVPCGASRS